MCVSENPNKEYLECFKIEYVYNKAQVSFCCLLSEQFISSKEEGGDFKVVTFYKCLVNSRSVFTHQTLLSIVLNITQRFKTENEKM